MTIDLPNTIWLKLVSDDTTPEWLAGYAGTRILLSEQQASQFPQPGTHDFFSVLGATIYGYVRAAQDGNGYEWVMEPTPDPLVVAVTSIPSEGSWANSDAGAMYVQIGRQLLAQGFSISETAWGLGQLYASAVNDFTQQPGQQG
jgi:hypothetical protein